MLPQMRAAVARILGALDSHERIVLFGDYDVDGVTSLALLAEMLRGYGATPELFLPLRMEEGYGLSRESVERCLEQYRPQLLIAIDCGTASASEIAELKNRGVDVIVLDHHEPKSQLPDCVAIVNPKADSASPFHYLCSVGIVFKLCHALLKTRPLPEFDLKSKLDLVALGTVADIVPLVEENRVLVQRGAIEIGRTSRVGLRKLMQVAGVRPPILPEDIGYRLGPRLNAAGRLSTAEKSLRLLLTKDEDEAAALATELDQQNRARQEVEKEILAAAIVTIEKQFDAARDAAIVAGARGWHPGVLGIVASRIARKYHRPTIVIGFDENGVGKGSGRSIDGLNLVDALTRCAATRDREIRRPRNGSRSGVTRGQFSEICRSVLQYRARVTFRRSSATLAATGSRAAVHKYRCRISPLARTFAAVRKWKSAATFLCACGRARRGAASLKRKASNFSVAPGQTAIVAPSISTARQMNFRHRPGTSHSALGWMNMAARLWLACGSRACAQPRRLEAPEFEWHDQRFDKP